MNGVAIFIKLLDRSISPEAYGQLTLQIREWGKLHYPEHYQSKSGPVTANSYFDLIYVLPSLEATAHFKLAWSHLLTVELVDDN